MPSLKFVIIEFAIGEQQEEERDNSCPLGQGLRFFVPNKIIFLLKI